MYLSEGVSGAARGNSPTSPENKSLITIKLCHFIIINYSEWVREFASRQWSKIEASPENGLAQIWLGVITLIKEQVDLKKFK